MAEFINTRDSMGEAAALDAVVAGTLSELNENATTTIGARALYGNQGLQKVNLPAVNTLNSYCMASCPSLRTVDIGVNCTINSNTFDGSSKLSALILRGTGSASSLKNKSGLTGTAIANGMGFVYVPSELVNTYKSATNWSNYADQVYSIDDYPRYPGDIQDSWSEILTAEANGTYSTKYHVGDTKYIEVNGVGLLMQIAAFDGDELADNTGNAKISWICKDIFATHNMNPTNTTDGGWQSSNMRSYLINDVLGNMSSDLRSAIKEVKKTYYDVGSSSTKTSNDSIWIPSYREVGFGTGKEESGVQYSELFTNDSSRIKKYNGSASYWWLRSAYSSTYFYSVSNDGAYNYYAASSSIGVVFGFCT